MKNTQPPIDGPFVRLPDCHGIAETLSDLVAHDPDWSTRPGVTVARGLLRDRDGTVLDTVVATDNRPNGRFAYLVVAQTVKPYAHRHGPWRAPYILKGRAREKGSGDWRQGGCLIDDAARRHLTAVLRSITGGEGEYP